MSQQFGARFIAEAIPAWKDFYVDYHQLKSLVHKIEHARQQNTTTESDNGTIISTLGVELANELSNGMSSAESHYRRVIDTLRHELKSIEAAVENQSLLKSYFGNNFSSSSSSTNNINTISKNNTTISSEQKDEDQQQQSLASTVHVERKYFQAQNDFQKDLMMKSGGNNFVSSPTGKESPSPKNTNLTSNNSQEEESSNNNTNNTARTVTNFGSGVTPSDEQQQNQQQQEELLSFDHLCATVLYVERMKQHEQAASMIGSSHASVSMDGEDNNRPLNRELSHLVDLYQLSVKLYRFVELNYLAIQRILMKFEQHVLNPFTSTNNNNVGITAEQREKMESELDRIIGGLRDQVRRSRFADGTATLRSTENLMRRIVDVATALHGRDSVEKYFSVTDAKGAEKKSAWTWTIKWKFVGLAFAILILLLIIPIFQDRRSAHNCLALIGCVATLWVSEAIPFFTTAMLIPLLAVPLRVLPGEDHATTGKTLLAATFDHVQILVLGGLCMGKALAKHKIENQIAAVCLKPLANRPHLFVLALMILHCVACAVLSNVAAPVLLLNVIQPTLWKMSRAEGAPQAILLCLAWSGNIGGMLTPIASPQNAVALKALGTESISFMSWVAAALPLCAVSLLLSWYVTLKIWDPFTDKNFVIPVVTGNDAAQEVDAAERRQPSGINSNKTSPLSRNTSNKKRQQYGGDSNDSSSNNNNNHTSDEEMVGGGGGVTTSTTTARIESDEDEDPTLPRRTNNNFYLSSPTSSRNNNHLPSPLTPSTLNQQQQQVQESVEQRDLKKKMAEKWLVVTTCILTIVLWCIPQEWAFGDAGITALIPIVVFFGVGVLSKEDFNSLPWHLLFLLAGGNMLGIIARESGLLEDTINNIRPFLENNSQMAVVCVLIIAVAIITTFVSHTVASLILMPVIAEIATANAALPSAQALVFLAVIMCSGSMTFPITSFPNVNSLLSDDEHGESYLIPKHFLLPGGLLSLASVLQLISYMVPFTEMLFPKN